MSEKTKTKIISKLIIFVLVLCLFQFATPTQAANTNISSLYSNPNQNNGKNPYKFKVSDVVNSNLLTNVVGCTGVVNKVSGWMTGFIQSPAKKAQEADDKFNRFVEKLKAQCSNLKAGIELSTGFIPIINDGVSGEKTILSRTGSPIAAKSGSQAGTPGPTLGAKLGQGASAGAQAGGNRSEKICLDEINATDPKQLKELMKQTEQDNERNLKEQCFDGIAITLAKNQLTSMTRSMMNWVNSGYGGNPFFVQNMQNFTNNIERNVIETGIDVLLSPANKSPYASDFARSTIRANRGIVQGSSNFLGSLQSDLEAFIADPKSYYTNDQLDQAQDTRDALQRARDANRAFQNDFSTGGWNAWLALTQKDQNNPLGFNMLANQYLADMETQRVTEVRDELAQNNGFMSQKTCIKWQVFESEGVPKINTNTNRALQPGETQGYVYQTSEPQYGKCVDWKVITPGSLIKDKTTAYLNSPERQLELAKTINDSLNALFSILMSKLQEGGLSGLADSNIDTTSNWTDSTNRLASSDGNTPYDNNGAYDGFNLTRDLGNTYLHVTTKSLGTWNASINKTSGGKALYPNLAPQIYDTEGNLLPSDNTYYTVSVAGNTPLMLEGHNNWEVGDRAFWNGTEWQNWKNGLPNPIKNRGVIQIQQDYIVAAKDILKVLPNVMPSLGELDYCIPGPNPSYETNSTDAQTAYGNWLGSAYVGPIDTTGERTGVRIHQPKTGFPGKTVPLNGTSNGSRTYDDLEKIFSDNPTVFLSLLEDKMYSIMMSFSYIDGNSDYVYDKHGEVSTEHDRFIAGKRNLQSTILDDANKSFESFFANFGKKMNDLYFKNMTSKYIDNEATSNLIPNTNGYVPMATSGLDLTQNMLLYSSDIAQATEDYGASINQAKINIAKLEPIKKEVSQIIKAAQDRRDANLVDILKRESQANGTPVLTPAQYKAKYASCLDEENMQFYDADTIETSAGEAGRCSNKLDDDLDGLIDSKDPDCSASNTTSVNYVYFKLQRCSDSVIYSTNLLPETSYGYGNVVQGGSGNYYRVVGPSSSTPIPEAVNRIDVTPSSPQNCVASGAVACTGPVTEPCYVANGTGTRTRSCISGVLSDPGVCATTCDPGYRLNVSTGTCVLESGTTHNVTVTNGSGGTFQGSSPITTTEGFSVVVRASPTGLNTKANFTSDCGGTSSGGGTNYIYTTNPVTKDCSVSITYSQF